MRARLLLLAVLGLGGLAGCGQKGPLYRPDQAPRDETGPMEATGSEGVASVRPGSA